MSRHFKRVNLTQYYETEWWKNLSKQTRKKRGKCELCGDTENLHVHHKRYRFYREDDSDLMVACEPCHLQVIHKQKTEDGLMDFDFNHRTKPDALTIDHAFQVEENRLKRRNKTSYEVDFRYLWQSMQEKRLTTKALAQFTKEEVAILVQVCIDSVLPTHPNNQIWEDKK